MIRQVVILRACDRRGFVRKAELFETGEEAFQMLAAKESEEDVSRRRRSAIDDEVEDEPGQVAVIEVGDRGVATGLFGNAGAAGRHGSGVRFGGAHRAPRVEDAEVARATPPQRS